MSDNGTGSLPLVLSLNSLGRESGGDGELGGIGLAVGEDNTVVGGGGGDVEGSLVGESGVLESVDVLFLGEGREKSRREWRVIS